MVRRRMGKKCERGEEEEGASSVGRKGSERHSGSLNDRGGAFGYE